MNKEALAKIIVVGVGGGGGNAVSRMLRGGLEGVHLAAMNTDAQVLAIAEAHQHLQLGRKRTSGLGAGGNPEVGREAAEESREDIEDALEGTDMVFVTAGMGGGTGTGAAPVVAEVAKGLGILTVAIVTRPFTFEGQARSDRAEVGIKRLGEHVDAIITIANDKLLKVAPPDTTLQQAFLLVDAVLLDGVRGITELITVPGLINLDFADVEAVLRGAGTAMMGIGEAEGENKTREAARRAISSPLLDANVKGSKRAILNISGGEDMTLEEVTEAAQVIQEALSDKADLIFGATIHEGMQKARITVVATGFPLSTGVEAAESDDSILLDRIEREGVVRDDYDLPAYLRRSRRLQGG